jgi:hypothetical protein
MKYRLYIDESGNPDLDHADDLRYRFLGLIKQKKATLSHRLDSLRYPPPNQLD